MTYTNAEIRYLEQRLDFLAVDLRAQVTAGDWRAAWGAIVVPRLAYRLLACMVAEYALARRFADNGAETLARVEADYARCDGPEHSARRSIERDRLEWHRKQRAKEQARVRRASRIGLKLLALGVPQQLEGYQPLK